MVLFWVLVLLAIILIVRALTHRGRWAGHPGSVHTMPASSQGPPGATPGDAAEQILADRLARGDIDVDDYHRRLAALREGTVPPPPTAPPPTV
jgi:putative membrane protein